MTDFVSAENAILATLKTAWDANAPALVGNVYTPQLVYEQVEASLKQHPRDGDKAWARVVVRHNDAQLATLSNAAGVRRRRRYGLAWVQVFAPAAFASGFELTTRLAQVALRAYEGKRADNGSVVFIRVSLMDQPQTGKWLCKDVKAQFYWDEIS